MSTKPSIKSMFQRWPYATLVLAIVLTEWVGLNGYASWIEKRDAFCSSEVSGVCPSVLDRVNETKAREILGEHPEYRNNPRCIAKAYTGYRCDEIGYDSDAPDLPVWARPTYWYSTLID